MRRGRAIACPARTDPVSEEAKLVAGGIIAALAFLLLAAIVWFRWCDTRRIP